MKQNNVAILPMTASHTAAIAGLEQQCFSDPWPESAVASELDNPLSYWLVAMDGRTVVGYVGSQTVLGEADIMNVAVAPSHRRQGIAAGLLERLRTDLKEQGVYSLTLEVRASNEAAIALYGLLGYVQVGRRPNYYHKPKEDALILRKEWEL
jgi:ribosomal-protein-alanine N-acetyltransferase